MIECTCSAAVCLAQARRRANIPRRGILRQAAAAAGGRLRSTFLAPGGRAPRTTPRCPCEPLASARSAELAIALQEMRPEGIEPSACGLKDRCSLAPRRVPLTTELRARDVSVGPRPEAGLRILAALAASCDILTVALRGRGSQGAPGRPRLSEACRGADRARRRAPAGHVDGPEAEQFGDRHDPVAAGAQRRDDLRIGRQRVARGPPPSWEMMIEPGRTCASTRGRSPPSRAAPSRAGRRSTAPSPGRASGRSAAPRVVGAVGGRNTHGV